jgi:hypothetical protein
MNLQENFTPPKKEKKKKRKSINSGVWIVAVMVLVIVGLFSISDFGENDAPPIIQTTAGFSEHWEFPPRYHTIDHIHETYNDFWDLRGTFYDLLPTSIENNGGNIGSFVFHSAEYENRVPIFDMKKGETIYVEQYTIRFASENTAFFLTLKITNTVGYHDVWNASLNVPVEKVSELTYTWTVAEYEYRLMLGNSFPEITDELVQSWYEDLTAQTITRAYTLVDFSTDDWGQKPTYITLHYNDTITIVRSPWSGTITTPQPYKIEDNELVVYRERSGEVVARFEITEAFDGEVIYIEELVVIECQAHIGSDVGDRFRLETSIFY